MKLVLISDTHCLHDEIELPDGDVLIHAGDACLRRFGNMIEFSTFANWFRNQPHRLKLYCPGNHDFIVQSDTQLCRGILEHTHCKMLIDEWIIINGIKFYGSPWVPNLSGWAFYASAQRLRDRFGDIPDDTNVLITHSPANGILDLVPGKTIGEAHGQEEDSWSDEKGVHVGSMALLKRINDLTKLQLHCFGHIHESAGHVEILRKHYTAVNACICDKNYDATNKPIVIEI